MSLAAAAILTLIATLATIAASGIAWPRQVIRAGLWLQKLETPDTPQDPGLPSGRHVRHADVAVRLAPLTPEADSHPAMPDSAFAPRPHSGETSFDFPIIDDELTPARPYLDRPGLWTEGHR